MVLTEIGKEKLRSAELLWREAQDHIERSLGEQNLAGLAIEDYMQELGLKIATDRKFGIVGLRWAAMKAGLGMIRRNNFFYTQAGS